MYFKNSIQDLFVNLHVKFRKFCFFHVLFDLMYHPYFLVNKINYKQKYNC